MKNNIFSIKKYSRHGYTLIEILIALSIMALLAVITVSVFGNFRNTQAISKDTETVVQVLRQARSQTIASLNSSQYGVRISPSKITLFTGSTYSSGAASNKDFPLTLSDTILTTTLAGGGSDIIFKRLSGETSQPGTILLGSPSTSNTKTITIYATGVIESN